MTEEKLKDIVNNKDHNAASRLDESDFMEVFYELIYGNYSEMDINEMNDIQRKIYLCPRLEDSVQADSLYSFIEDGLGYYLKETAETFRMLGAVKTSDILDKVAEAVPENVLNGDEPDEKLWDKLMKYDSIIGDYPDGPLTKIYFKFAQENVKEIF
ncbi:MAG: hypothetical protein IJ446_10025 [Oscillospiraceae bacterium]|nr:hypothetical protein [Oscillospiraceae bacterium]